MLVLFVAPTGLFRDGVARLLAELATRVEVRCTDYAAIALLERGSIPDLLVLDGDNIREALNAVNVVRRIQPDLPVAVLLTAIDSRSVDSFLAAGVGGCVGKAECADVLLDALRHVLAGHAHLPPALRTFIPDAASPPDQARRPPDATPHATPGALTKRQVEVLALAARGEPNKLIARRLNITEGTVKVHLHSVYKALKVSSRGQASMTAARLQEVSDVQIHQALEDQLSVPRLLAHMTPARTKAGETLFHKNASSDALYYVVRGTVRLLEFGVEVGPGTMLGEIGLFSPDHRRTCTARCQSDCDLLSASAADAIRLYYQDPEFAMYLIHLLARRLGASDLARKAR
ncbi:DNA-binding NarL/FixJ family response regulator [Paraburkholderia sp. JPY158]|uniref:DNA-binding NarL/FixJ family response regulator n=1 Tax=Paraburkholderia atlantica TaxID=2654982 RepID=A0A7W8V4U6_PARAM|nr:LuxR C-terminal-related transcriptional regulator [Paraburkholderia atlantica]MBB5423114.1 DNA-binding NarL/FixJ family response regulator [Paraburkholderia atlantica]